MKPEELRTTATVLEELSLSYEARARKELSSVKKLAKRRDALAHNNNRVSCVLCKLEDQGRGEKRV